MGQYEELFRKSIESLNRQDAAEFRSLVAPDADYTTPLGSFQGRDAISASFEPEWRAFPDGKHEVLRVLETATGVAAECRWTGTHNGPLATPMGEVPATGRPIVLDYAIWVDVAAGLAKRIRVYADGMDYAVQLGLMPQPQQA